MRGAPAGVPGAEASDAGGPNGGMASLIPSRPQKDSTREGDEIGPLS